MRVSTLMRTVMALGLCAGVLADCAQFRDAAGLGKKSPDEFAVSTKAPLIIPPDFNLRPPMPGAAPTNQMDPTATAEQALFNTSDPQTVANGMRGDYTPGEKMLMANARVQNADPAVRAKLNTDQRLLQNANGSFTSRVLGTQASNDTQPVNGDAEIDKRSGDKPGDAKSKPDSGGWFDWF